MSTKGETTEAVSKKKVAEAYEVFQQTLKDLNEKPSKQVTRTHQGTRAGERLERALNQMVYSAAEATFFPIVVEELGEEVWLLWRSVEEPWKGGKDGKGGKDVLQIDVAPIRHETFDGEPVSDWLS